MKTRLNKVLSERGIASRRQSDQLITEGRIQINGKRVYELGVQVDPHQDKILVDGKPLRSKAPLIYVMMNKPKGVLTTLTDPLGRPTVSDFLNKVPYRVFPVGRLDWDSEGMLLLTNDGEYANQVMNPKSNIQKKYLVKLDRDPKFEHLQKLLRGVTIKEGKVAAVLAQKIAHKSKKHSWVEIIITEGKNRQIRQMFEKIGYDVLKLQRIAIGKLNMGSLPKGQIVFLNDVSADRVLDRMRPAPATATVPVKVATAGTAAKPSTVAPLLTARPAPKRPAKEKDSRKVKKYKAEKPKAKLDLDQLIRSSDL